MGLLFYRPTLCKITVLTVLYRLAAAAAADAKMMMMMMLMMMLTMMCRRIRRQSGRGLVNVNGRPGTSLACVVYSPGWTENHLRPSPVSLLTHALACKYPHSTFYCFRFIKLPS